MKPFEYWEGYFISQGTDLPRALYNVLRSLNPDESEDLLLTCTAGLFAACQKTNAALVRLSNVLVSLDQSEETEDGGRAYLAEYCDKIKMCFDVITDRRAQFEGLEALARKNRVVQNYRKPGASETTNGRGTRC